MFFWAQHERGERTTIGNLMAGLAWRGGGGRGVLLLVWGQQQRTAGFRDTAAEPPEDLKQLAETQFVPTARLLAGT